MCVVLGLCFLIRVAKESVVWTWLKKGVAKCAMLTWERYDSFEHEIYDYDVLSETLRVLHTEVDDEDLVIR